MTIKKWKHDWPFSGQRKAPPGNLPLYRLLFPPWAVTQSSLTQCLRTQLVPCSAPIISDLTTHHRCRAVSAYGLGLHILLSVARSQCNPLQSSPSLTSTEEDTAGPHSKVTQPMLPTLYWLPKMAFLATPARDVTHLPPSLFPTYPERV